MMRADGELYRRRSSSPLSFDYNSTRATSSSLQTALVRSFRSQFLSKVSNILRLSSMVLKSLTDNAFSICWTRGASSISRTWASALLQQYTQIQHVRRSCRPQAWSPSRHKLSWSENARHWHIGTHPQLMKHSQCGRRHFAEVLPGRKNGLVRGCRQDVLFWGKELELYLCRFVTNVGVAWGAVQEQDAAILSLHVTIDTCVLITQISHYSSIPFSRTPRWW